MCPLVQQPADGKDYPLHCCSSERRTDIVAGRNRRAPWGDLLAEQSFIDAEVSHDTRPNLREPPPLTLEFTINEGKRGAHLLP